MSTLQDFLNSNPVDDMVAEVVISDRFKDKDGNLLKFKIKAMTNRTFDELRRKCTKIRGRKTDFDANAFNISVVIENTISPDFKDAESLKKLNCMSPDQYVERVLLAGEIVQLAQEISKLSGFDVEMDELVEEAKN